MENVAEEQGLALQQIIHTNLINFFKNSNHYNNSFFNARDLKLGHFNIFAMLFPFLEFVKF